MLDLAMHEGRGPIQSHDIHERQRIPEPYLNQLLTVLRKAGLITSRRGPGGGHMLARQAHAVTIAEIVEVLEGQVLGELSADEQRRARGATSTAEAIQELWKQVGTTVAETLNAVTLADMVERARRRAYTYQI